MNSKNDLHHDDVSVCMITKQCLHKCLENWDFTPRDAKVFYSSVFEFFTEAVRYELKKLPTHNKLLQHARFLDVIDKNTSFHLLNIFAKSIAVGTSNNVLRSL